MTDTQNISNYIKAVLSFAADRSPSMDLIDAARSQLELILARITKLEAHIAAERDRGAAFQLGDRVEKINGSSWCGKVVGTYSTALTPEGYAVESEREPGSVQIYPAKALRLASEVLKGTNNDQA